MADTYVEIEDKNGVARKVDARTEGTNTEFRQVVSIGDPSTNAGIAPVDASAGLYVSVRDTDGSAVSAAVDRLTDNIGVAVQTDVLMNDTTALTPKFAAISSTDDGDTVAAVASKKIRVTSMFFVVAGATTVKFQSGASTDKTGAMSFAANGGICLPDNPRGWFETASGEKLNHVLGSNVAIAGGLSYVEV